MNISVGKIHVDQLSVDIAVISLV